MKTPNGEIRTTPIMIRRFIKNITEFLNILNSKMKYHDVYVSLYSYARRSYEDFTKGDYTTADITHTFFDIDSGYKSAKELYDVLKSRSLTMSIIFTGRGYHFYIPVEKRSYSQLEQLTLRNFQMWIKYRCTVFDTKTMMGNMDTENIIDIDKQCVGRVSQLVRFPGSYNFKRKNRCIPVTEDEFLNGHDFVIDLSKKTLRKFTGMTYSHGKKLNLKFWDKEMKWSRGIEITEDMLDGQAAVMDKLPFDICPGLKYALSHAKTKRMGYHLRSKFILHCRMRGYTVEDVDSWFKYHMTDEEYNHCVYIDRQITGLMKNGNYYTTCESIDELGYCTYGTNKQSCIASHHYR